MQEIINGRLFDTETATPMGSYSYGASSDFQHVSETLYRKKTEEYFLRGEGGPMSRYSVEVGVNNYSGSSRITPLDEDEAKEWLEMYGTVEEYEACFGPVEE